MSKLSTISRDLLEQMYQMRVVQLHQAKKDIKLGDDMYLDMERRLNEVEHRNSLLRAELLLARARYTLGDTQ